MRRRVAPFAAGAKQSPNITWSGCRSTSEPNLDGCDLWAFLLLSTAVNKSRLASSTSEAPSRSDASQEEHAPHDRDLVCRCQQGDHKAFRLLFDRYNRRVYVLALGVVHDEDDALDVVQEAFLRAHRSLHQFEGNAAFFTWIYRIVMNVAIDHLRRQGRAKRVDYDDAVAHLESDPGLADSFIARPIGGHPGRDLARRELRDKLDGALAQLSPNHRAVLVMREVDGLSYEEMAQAMSCSKGTIMSRLFHARRYMQKLLRDCLD